MKMTYFAAKTSDRLDLNFYVYTKIFIWVKIGYLDRLLFFIHYLRYAIALGREHTLTMYYVSGPRIVSWLLFVWANCNACPLTFLTNPSPFNLPVSRKVRE